MNYDFNENIFTAHEFLESWEKELYQVTQLDLFAFRIINYIAPKIEYYFRTRDVKNANLFLENTDDISHFCFNLGDNYAHFLERMCFGSCPLKCPRNLTEVVDKIPASLPGKISRNIEALMSISDEKPDKEQIFRFDILDQVILESIYQYYSEYKQIELDEDDISVLEFAEYLEDITMDFTTQQKNHLLLRPFDNAINQFELLLANEITQSNSRNLKRGNSSWEEEQLWKNPVVSPQALFSAFSEEMDFSDDQANMELLHDLQLLKKFILEEKKLQNIGEIDAQLLREFFTFYLVHEFILNYDQQIPHIFNATARLLSFMDLKYNIQLKQEFIDIYNTLKTDLPRIINSFNDFINNLNLADTLFGDEEILQHGVYQVQQKEISDIRIINLSNLSTGYILKPVLVESKLEKFVRVGDIFRCSLNFRQNHWRIIELQGIYPALAREFIRI